MLTLSRYFLRIWLLCFLQVHGVLLAVYALSRMISQLYYLNADYTWSSAFAYVLAVFPSELLSLELYLLLLSTWLFVWRVQANHSFRAAMTLGFSSWRLSVMLGFLTVIVFLALDLYRLESATQQYQQAKWSRQVRLTGSHHEILWWGDAQYFWRAEVDFLQARLANVMRVEVASKPKVQRWQGPYTWQKRQWQGLDVTVPSLEAMQAQVLGRDKLTLSQLFHLQPAADSLLSYPWLSSLLVSLCQSLWLFFAVRLLLAPGRDRESTPGTRALPWLLVACLCQAMAGFAEAMVWLAHASALLVLLIATMWIRRRR